MSEIVSKIKYAMSLRTPQEEALSYLDAISSHCDYKKDSKAVVEAAASEYCEKQRKVKAGFDFPSFCFAMATGIGKTRLMGACIYHLYKTKGYKHFFILAPGNTIYDKLRKESNPNHPKYIFKGLEAEMGRPKVYDGENYDTYPVKFEQMSLRIEKTSEIQLFIFNIGKIFNSKTDTQFNFHKFKETLGASFADVLAQFDDLVICMDEAHRYYAPASMKAINYLKPILGLEFTATPKTTSNVIYAYDLARGAVEGYLKIPVVMGRSNMAGYNQDDIEEMKIRDGLTLHEHRKAVLREYCSDNDLDYVKPIVLIACKDTDHAKKIRALIDSDDFQKGKYKGKVIEIHSKQSGEESEENIRLLLSIESASNPKSDASNGTSNAKAMLKRSCPELSDAHCEDIVASILGAMTMSDSDKVSLVVTAPPSFAIKARTTMNVVQSMINGADRNILITGYSLSSYFSELVDTIIQKSQRGVFVKFFVNDIDKQPDFDKVLRYKGRFLKIYNYRQEDDKMAALHAKVISVDQQQTLITSANLSYHGQQGNIELGTLIESKQIAKQIDDVFTKMIFSKVFSEV